MNAALLTMALAAGLGGQKCLCLRLMAKLYDPQAHTCCVPRYGCVAGQSPCPSCGSYGRYSSYDFRRQFNYPWSDPRRPMMSGYQPPPYGVNFAPPRDGLDVPETINDRADPLPRKSAGP